MTGISDSPATTPLASGLERGCGVPHWRAWLTTMLVLMPVLALPGVVRAGAAEPGSAEPATTRVLIVHSFGRDFAPFGASTAAFRREFAMRQPGRVIYMEATLDAGRPLGAAEEAAFAAYLKARYCTK